MSLLLLVVAVVVLCARVVDGGEAATVGEEPAGLRRRKGEKQLRKTNVGIRVSHGRLKVTLPFSFFF